MKAPERIETSRIRLRKPVASDAEPVFHRYAADPEVTKFLAWPTHTSIEQTIAFIAFSDAEWERWPAGPYLIESRADGTLLGGTGLAFEAPDVASTGYVLARDAWGHGYATEALKSIVVLASELGVRRLHTQCHPTHVASIHVLEKCGFALEERMLGCVEFPNLGSSQLEDCFRYVRVLG